MSARYDAVIVGAGSNGLTCAAFLALAGKRVLVLEALDRVGGFATTEELTAGAPGFRYNKHAIDLFSGMIPPSIVDDLQLERYGFRTTVTDPYATYLGPDGTVICQWRDIDRTAREIARYSRRDAVRYTEFANILCEAWDAALPYLQGHPKSITPRAFMETVWRAAKARKSLGPAARILVSSPAQVLEEWFERDELKVILGTWAAATGSVSLETPGSAAGMAMAVLSHRWGCFRAVGGMGALMDALARFITAHGGEIRTRTPVASVRISGDRADGVILEGGEEVAAADVVCAVDPARLFGKLLPQTYLPEKAQDELRAMATCAQNTTYFTGHAALTGRPSLPRHGRDQDVLSAGYQMIVPSYESVRHALAAAAGGNFPQEIPVWVSYPSVADRTLVPSGSDGETLYFMTPVTPYRLADGRDWSDERDPYLRRVLNVIDDYMPIDDLIIDSYGVTPIEMSQQATFGHAAHVDMTLSQMGPWRPTPSLSGYQTPVSGLWQVSVGAHPIPAVNGWAGRTAARTLLHARTTTRGRLSLPTRRARRIQSPSTLGRAEIPSRKTDGADREYATTSNETTR